MIGVKKTGDKFRLIPYMLRYKHKKLAIKRAYPVYSCQKEA